MVLIPSQAVQTGQDGQFVWLVKGDSDGGAATDQDVAHPKRIGCRHPGTECR